MLKQEREGDGETGRQSKVSGEPLKIICEAKESGGGRDLEPGNRRQDFCVSEQAHALLVLSESATDGKTWPHNHCFAKIAVISSAFKHPIVPLASDPEDGICSLGPQTTPLTLPDVFVPFPQMSNHLLR
jgi:hypothetical protein